MKFTSNEWIKLMLEVNIQYLSFPFQLMVLCLCVQMTLLWPRQSVSQVRARRRGTPLAVCGER